MSRASMHSFELGGAKSSTRMVDQYAILPILACLYAAVVGPILIIGSTANLRNAEPGLAQRLFWPAMAAVSAALVVRNFSRLGKLPPNIICLLAYAAFAGASVLWAFRPEASFVRYLQQAMVLTSIVLPAMLAARTADLMRGVFLCCATGAILNVFFVFNQAPTIVPPGYPGYFAGKNYLGEFAAVTLLLSLHEVLYPGLRRALGIIVVVISILLLLWSQSKTAFALALVCPFLAGTMLIIRRITGISLAAMLLFIPFCYVVLSSVTGFNMNRVSSILYGDPTFTGRTIIWDFANYEIERRPLLGWGYQSFWLVGGDAPSAVEAPGFVKNMPNSHNGYYDTMLELGYVGYGFLVIFLAATVHAIGRMADRDRRRGWFVLAIALYIIIYNYLESFWMRGFEFLWVVFVIIAADIGRHWQPFPLTGPEHGARNSTPGSAGPSRSVRMRRLRIPMKRPGLTASMPENCKIALGNRC